MKIPLYAVLSSLMKIHLHAVLPSLMKIPLHAVLSSLMKIPLHAVLPSLMKMPLHAVLPSLMKIPLHAVLPSLIFPLARHVIIPSKPELLCCRPSIFFTAHLTRYQINPILTITVKIMIHCKRVKL